MSEAVVVDAPAAGAQGARPRRGLANLRIAGLSLSGALSLAAVLAVLLVVSVPRLHGLALQENEADAKATAVLLARALQASPRPAPTLRELLRRRELAGLAPDSELLADGRLLRRHGYLFEITRLDPAWSAAGASLGLLSNAPSALAPPLAVRAWPWRHGATGRSAFLVTVNGALLQHPSGADLQGLEAAGAGPAALQAWRPAH